MCGSTYSGQSVAGAQYGGGYPTHVSPAMMGPGGWGGPAQVSPAMMGPGGYGLGGYPAQVGPANIAPTQVSPAVVSPTNNILNKNIMKTIVPHVHPTHTTTVNEHVYQHQHYFPHTKSVVNQCCSQQLICTGMPPAPTIACPPPRPFCC